MTRWCDTKKSAALGKNSIDVWRVCIPKYLDNISYFLTLLNPQELDRAKRYLVENAYHSFVITRGILRILLARYLDIAPQTIAFQQNSYGKPYLKSSTLQFNLSHSREFSLLAFAHTHLLGIDIEFMDSTINCESITQRFFSPTEYAALLALPKQSRKRAFFNCWSRKEAMVKAQGTGLFTSLNSFTTQISPDKNHAANIILPQNNGKNEEFFVLSFDPGKSYAAALAFANYQQQVINFINY